ncbi:hypothetical protein EMIHUDRAFT_47047, partial [Emiliania huxleyi CCMP1516]|uniref:non-specific serine/threonine protein kinase n=2 Tax=Emiliania huxleyi TaxID=2903 RepID=A0A0D3KJ70_EMIH1
QRSLTASRVGRAHLYHAASGMHAIVMEAAGGGELFSRVLAGLTEAEARPIFGHMAAGVLEMHTRGVAHRDLKLENAVFDADGALRWIDFGLAKVFDAALSETERSPSAAARQPAAGGLFSACGSDSYLAPEVYALRKSNTSGSASSLVPGYDGYAADMWSLGICLFAMVAGIFPF